MARGKSIVIEAYPRIRLHTVDDIVRSKSNRRKHGRKLTIPLMLVMTILLAVMTSASISAFEWLRGNFFNCSIFTLKGISVQGNNRVRSEDILDTAGLQVGTDRIYSIACHIVEERIRSRFRYLEHVEIQRRLVLKRNEGIYGWVTIQVEEREPAVLVKEGTGEFPASRSNCFTIIDSYGFILEKGIQSPREDIPIVVGYIPKTAADNALSFAGFSALSLALDVLIEARSVLPDLFHQIYNIRSIDARDPDNIMIYLQIRNAPSAACYQCMPEATIRIASDRIREGLSGVLQVITAYAAKCREENSEVGVNAVIDVRFPGAIYCKHEG